MVSRVSSAAFCAKSTAGISRSFYTLTGFPRAPVPSANVIATWVAAVADSMARLQRRGLHEASLSPGFFLSIEAANGAVLIDNRMPLQTDITLMKNH